MPSILFYDFVPDVLERRTPYREAHLAMLRALLAEGKLVMAGALGDPPHGAAIVFQEASDAEAFVAVDPYIAGGLVTGHRIEPWAVAVGG